MGRRKQSTSRRTKKEIADVYTKILNTAIRTIDYINDRMDKHESVSDEQLRFLKNSREIIRSLQETQKDIDTVAEETLPEGRLKEWVEQLYSLQELYREAIDNPTAALTKEATEQVADASGYYVCNKCSHLHLKGRECMFSEFLEKSKLKDR